MKDKEEYTSLKERILCAAIWYDNHQEYRLNPKNIDRGIVITGYRHSECIQTLCLMFYPNWKNNRIDDILRIHCNNHQKQGFLTNHNRFVDRTEAIQVNYTDRTRELYSEDIY